MSLASAADLSSLDQVWNGQPWCVITAHTGQPFFGFNPSGVQQTGTTTPARSTTLQSLDQSWNGQPYCVVAPHNGSQFYFNIPTVPPNEQTGLAASPSPAPTLPTTKRLTSLDYSYNGQPWCVVAASANIDTTTLDISWQGQPIFAPSRTHTGNMMMIF